LEIYSYIAEDNPGAARSVVGKLRRATRRAGEMPWAGRVVLEFEVAELRERIVPPFRVVYLVRDEVVIVRLWHSRRDLTRLGELP
jgi:plasmid stabilization system protein ParE